MEILGARNIETGPKISNRGLKRRFPLPRFLKSKRWVPKIRGITQASQTFNLGFFSNSNNLSLWVIQWLSIEKMMR